MGSARHYPLGAIAADLQAAHVADTLAAVDTDARVVNLQSGAALAYDVLVIAVGARPTAVFPRTTTFETDIRAVAHTRPVVSSTPITLFASSGRFDFATPP